MCRFPYRICFMFYFIPLFGIWYLCFESIAVVIFFFLIFFLCFLFLAFLFFAFLFGLSFVHVDFWRISTQGISNENGSIYKTSSKRMRMRVRKIQKERRRKKERKREIACKSTICGANSRTCYTPTSLYYKHCKLWDVISSSITPKTLSI